MNTNYDKELLLDFIEWLSEKHNIHLAQDLERGFSERVVEYEFIGIVDQYLEDDE